MLIFWLLLGLAGGGGEVLVLKDGKAIPIAEPFEIKDQFVHFKDTKGRLMMLPLKVVDLEESKRRNELAKTTGAEPSKKEDPEKADDLVAHARTQRSDMVLTDHTLNKFNTDNPRDETNPAMDTGEYRSSPGSATSDSRLTWEAKARRDQIYERQIQAVEQQIRDKKEEIRRFQTDNGPHWDFNHKKEQSKVLKNQLASLEKQLLNLKDYARTGPPPRAPRNAVPQSAQNYERKEYNQRIKYLRQEIKRTRDEIQKLKRSNSSPYYLSQLAYRKERVANLEAQIKAYNQEILDIQKQARAKGIDTQ